MSVTEPTSAPLASPSPTAALNANHARRILSTFAYIDGLLQRIERLAEAQSSEFASEQPDLSETEGRLLLSLVETARHRMLATVDHLGITRPKTNLSARWSAATAFRFIDIALSDLTPQTLRGYGTIDANSAAEVNAVAGELRDLIARGRELLQPQEGERLRDRLVGIEGPLGEILRAAEELSTRLGLVEVRSLIAAAAERATTNTIDIGIFGRVSSGKSSLINALVGAPLLPVGATPVTAVPLRVVHGPDAIEVFFADGRTESIDATRLSDFATEAGNRDNVRRVQSILIHTPRLPDGLALLDTPGVGSLSQSGPAQAFAWLPRCDLGIVLVAAGTPLGRDELALVSGLTHAGIAVDVLLSKSDLISESERTAAVDYVKGEVVRASGRSDISVRAVSVMESARHLLDHWREEELTPMVAARLRVAEASRARRIRALLGALNASMVDQPALDRSSVDLHRARIDAEREISEATDGLQGSARSKLSDGAEAVAAAWHSGADANAVVRQALLDAPNHALSRARAAADHILEIAGITGSDDAAGRIPPLFDPPFLDALPVAASPGGLDRLLGRTRAAHQLGPLADPLEEAYGTYANRVRAWGIERLDATFERIASARPRDTAHIAPELGALAQMIDAHFPTPNE